MNQPDSTAKKYAENRRSEGLKLRTSEKIAIAEQHSLKSCGIATAKVFPSSCGIPIADSKKSCACPPLVVTHFQTSIDEHNCGH
jgi:hypothetical protein